MEEDLGISQPSNVLFIEIHSSDLSDIYSSIHLAITSVFSFVHSFFFSFIHLSIHPCRPFKCDFVPFPILSFFFSPPLSFSAFTPFFLSFSHSLAIPDCFSLSLPIPLPIPFPVLSFPILPQPLIFTSFNLLDPRAHPLWRFIFPTNPKQSSEKAF